MDERKINHEYISEYSKKFAAEIVESHFIQSEQITGKEILHFSNFKQLNFFILRNLFKKWNEETKKLKSPYFDYKHEKVKKALADFMNTLSQHISIRKEDFHPLAEIAAEESLYMVFSPFEFLWAEFEEKKYEKVTLRNFKGRIKYFKVNGFILSELVSKMEEEGKDVFNYEELIEPLEAIYQMKSENLEDPDNYIPTFNAVVLFDKNEIYSGEKEADEDMQAREEAFDPDSFVIEEEDNDYDEDNEGLEETLNSSYAEKKSTVKDQVTQKPKESIVDAHTNSKVDQILSSISLNQQFMFSRDLFNDDKETFEEAISKVDGMDSFDEAVSLLVKEYAKKYKWDMNSPEVKELLKVIFRRFR
ncbi:MAG TPA: hypothetical protein ACFCUD_02980 [Cyclobacteriaceae bacterium]